MAHSVPHRESHDVDIHRTTGHRQSSATGSPSQAQPALREEQINQLHDQVARLRDNSRSPSKRARREAQTITVMAPGPPTPPTSRSADERSDRRVAARASLKGTAHPASETMLHHGTAPAISPNKTKRRRRESLHGQSPNKSGSQSARAAKMLKRMANGTSESIEDGDTLDQYGDSSNAVSNGAGSSSRLRWTPGSKSFVMVDRVGNSSVDTILDEEAHMRDKIILLPTERARNLSRVRVLDSSASMSMASQGQQSGGHLMSRPDDDFEHVRRTEDVPTSQTPSASLSPRIHRVERQSASPSRIAQLPSKPKLSPRKTALTPVRHQFAPPSSSPLARQVDESLSALLDEEWPADNDDMLLSPLPIHKALPHHATGNSPANRPLSRHGTASPSARAPPRSLSLLHGESASRTSGDDHTFASKQVMSGQAISDEPRKEFEFSPERIVGAPILDVSDSTGSSPARSLLEGEEATEAPANVSSSPSSEHKVVGQTALDYPKESTPGRQVQQQHIKNTSPASPSRSSLLKQGVPTFASSSQAKGVVNRIGSNSPARAQEEQVSTPTPSTRRKSGQGSRSRLSSTASPRRHPDTLTTEAQRETSERDEDEHAPDFHPLPQASKSKIVLENNEARHNPVVMSPSHRITRINPDVSPDDTLSKHKHKSQLRQEGRPDVAWPGSARDKQKTYAHTSPPPAQVTNESGKSKSRDHLFTTSFSTPPRSRASRREMSARITPTPSPRRRLTTHATEARLGTQSPGTFRSNSSMILTSPYQASTLGTPRDSHSMSLRRLLDSHRKRVEHGTPPSQAGSQRDGSLAPPTPTPRLRRVGGRTSTPHPYRLQVLEKHDEADKEDDDSDYEHVPSKTDVQSPTPPDDDDARHYHPSLLERDLTTILAEEDVDDEQANDNVDLTFEREADRSGEASRHVPSYRRSSANIFKSLEAASEPHLRYDDGDDEKPMEDMNADESATFPDNPGTRDSISRVDSSQHSLEDDDSASEVLLFQVGEQVGKGDGQALIGFERDLGSDVEELRWDDESGKDPRHQHRTDAMERRTESAKSASKSEGEELNHSLEVQDVLDGPTKTETAFESEEDEVSDVDEDRSMGERISKDSELDKLHSWSREDAQSPDDGELEDWHASRRYDTGSSEEEDGPVEDDGSENFEGHDAEGLDSEYASEADEDDPQSHSDGFAEHSSMESGMPGRHFIPQSIEQDDQSVSDSPYAALEESDDGKGWMEELDSHIPTASFRADRELAKQTSEPTWLENPRRTSENTAPHDHGVDNVSDHGIYPYGDAIDLDNVGGYSVGMESEGHESPSDEIELHGSDIDGDSQSIIAHSQASVVEMRDEELEDQFITSTDAASSERVLNSPEGINKTTDIEHEEELYHSSPRDKETQDLSHYEFTEDSRASSPAHLLENEAIGAHSSRAASVNAKRGMETLQNRSTDRSSVSAHRSLRDSSAMEGQASITLSNVMRHRANMLASRPSMVEVSSMNRDAAARAAEILKMHHKYVQYGTLEANLDDESWAHTMIMDPGNDRLVDACTVQYEGTANSRSKDMKENTDEAESEQGREAWKVKSTPSRIGSKSAFTHATPVVPGAFPGSAKSTAKTRTSKDSSPSKPHLRVEASARKIHDRHPRGYSVDLHRFAEEEWSCLDRLLVAEIVAHANDLRASQVISKSQALLRAAKMFDRQAIIDAFLDAHHVVVTDQQSLHEWSERRLRRRVQILVKRFIFHLKDQYPHLEVDFEEAESVAATDVSSPATPAVRTMLDESGVAASIERLPFKMVVESTPGPGPMRNSLRANPAAMTGDRTEHSLYPSLPGHDVEAIHFSDLSGDRVCEPKPESTPPDPSLNATGLLRQGFGMLSSLFALIGKGNVGTEPEAAESLSDSLDEGPRVEMQEAPLRGELATVPRTKSSASAPLQQSISRRGQDAMRRTAPLISATSQSLTTARWAQRHESVEHTSHSFRTGRTWRPPAHVSTANISHGSTRNLTISRSPIRRINSGASSYVQPTALSMLSPHTHAEARSKVSAFRESRADRQWRSPRQMYERSLTSGSRHDNTTATRSTINSFVDRSHRSGEQSHASKSGAGRFADPHSTSLRFRNF